MNSSYATFNTIYADEDEPFNMHEFNLIHEGKSALRGSSHHRLYESSDSDESIQNANIDDTGFRELDFATGNATFEWNALDHIDPSESLAPNPSTGTWDYLYVLRPSQPYLITNDISSHLNSVDKNAEGDYLISSRYTDCIYKISGVDGSIIWRLGGANSSFILDGFNFSGQHDARFRQENSSTTTISFLNNASNGHKTTSAYSSALLVVLQTSTTPMTAAVVMQWDRPDRQLTHLRGNMQFLPNTNVFIGWSENGYISEFTAGGHCVLEASFTSHRLVNYRAYKFNFTGNPTEPPALKAYAFGTSNTGITIVHYVSWNGATEVASWNFYGSSNSSSRQFSLVGSAKRSGFETMHMSAGYLAYVFAEAIAVDGRSLGNSSVQATIIPPNWEDARCRESGCQILNIEARAPRSEKTSRYYILSLGIILGCVLLFIARPCAWPKFRRSAYLYAYMPVQ